MSQSWIISRRYVKIDLTMEINRKRGISGKNTTHPSMHVSLSRESNAMCLIHKPHI